jgi:hypothetical protein
MTNSKLVPKNPNFPKKLKISKNASIFQKSQNMTKNGFLTKS